MSATGRTPYTMPLGDHVPNTLGEPLLAFIGLLPRLVLADLASESL